MGRSDGMPRMETKENSIALLSESATSPDICVRDSDAVREWMPSARSWSWLRLLTWRYPMADV